MSAPLLYAEFLQKGSTGSEAVPLSSGVVRQQTAAALPGQDQACILCWLQ